MLTILLLFTTILSELIFAGLFFGGLWMMYIGSDLMVYIWSDLRPVRKQWVAALCVIIRYLRRRWY